MADYSPSDEEGEPPPYIRGSYEGPLQVDPNAMPGRYDMLAYLGNVHVEADSGRAKGRVSFLRMMFDPLKAFWEMHVSSLMTLVNRGEQVLDMGNPLPMAEFTRFSGTEETADRYYTTASLQDYVPKKPYEEPPALEEELHEEEIEPEEPPVMEEEDEPVRDEKPSLQEIVAETLRRVEDSLS